MTWIFGRHFIVLLVLCVGETVVASGYLTDCYVVGESDDYSGTRNTTAYGFVCQRWDSQSPHEHTQESEYFPEGSLCKALNYCRDPDHTGYPWCYTTDNYTRWQECDVPECDQPIPDTSTPDGHLTDCYVVGESDDYSGTRNTTAYGFVCQRWDSQSPHEHTQESEYFPEGSLCKALNYCRDPDHTGYPWCYTTDNYTRWQACDVPECDQPTTNTSTLNDCYSGETHDYSGSVNMTVSGLTCQRWDSQSPHAHTQTVDRFPESSLCKARNYCRDPDYTGVPWCYTMDESTRWEACDVCHDGVTHRITPSYTTTDTLSYTTTGSPGYTNTGMPSRATTGSPGYTNTGMPSRATTGSAGYTNTDTPSHATTGTLSYTNTGTPRNTPTDTQSHTTTGAPSYTNTDVPDYTTRSEHIYTTSSASASTYDCYIFTEDDLNSTKAYTEICESSPYRSSVEYGVIPAGCEDCDQCCQAQDCYEYDYITYNGTWHRTPTGLQCQRWDVQSPHSHINTESYQYPDQSVSDAHNYCRDPEHGGRLWCYTTDPETRWEYCDIEECNGDVNLYE